MRRFYPVLLLVVAAALVVGAVGGYVAHPATKIRTTGLQSITTRSTRAQVEAHFNLGTDQLGRRMYTDTSCIEKVCAWDYRGGKKPRRWSVTIYFEQPHAAMPAMPPMRPVGQG